ncbi:MAG: metallophosphatase family protein [Verrucomicrobiae bacterium]|nr:metallophosphatase family protein [Verrucomicrobiae bacterium]NNJ87428.1 metallophosphoesterase family protein [Akkermansiaceae bacterium]
MKYAVLSDIHANLEALNSVLEDVRARGVKRFICLGDIVGYNANPSECVDTIHELGCPVIMGNHDAYTVADQIPETVNGRARQSLEWTRAQIRPDQRKWLAHLPMQRRVGAFEIVHASMHQPDEWNYVINAIEAILHFHFQETPLCFFGHTHHPMFFSTKERKTHKNYDRIKLEEGIQYFVNAGSVGQPRGDDKRAQYVVYDTCEKTIEMCRVEYDVALACQKIRAAGLPEHNALRLEKPDMEAAAALKLIEGTQSLVDSLK